MARILVVEDKNDDRLILMDVLKEANHTAVCVSNANEAVEQLHSDTFDVICLDQSLPGQSGADFYHHIKNNDQFGKLQVIFVTAFDEDKEIKKLKQQGIYVIKKPLDYKELQKAIALALKKRVLIVEDREDDREILVDIFKSGGYRVHAANDAKQALRILKKEPFNLVVTDYALPGSTGLEMYHDIRNKLKMDRIPFIFTSIHGSRIDMKKIEQEGVYFFDKPFNPKLLLEKAKEIIKKSWR